MWKTEDIGQTLDHFEFAGSMGEVETWNLLGFLILSSKETFLCFLYLMLLMLEFKEYLVYLIMLNAIAAFNF